MVHIFTEMRFRFCGGEDCPDWLLAEISSLAAVSVVKVRQLTAEVKTIAFYALKPNSTQLFNIRKSGNRKLCKSYAWIYAMYV